MLHPFIDYRNIGNTYNLFKQRYRDAVESGWDFMNDAVNLCDELMGHISTAVADKSYDDMRVFIKCFKYAIDMVYPYHYDDRVNPLLPEALYDTDPFELLFQPAEYYNNITVFRSASLTNLIIEAELSAFDNVDFINFIKYYCGLFPQIYVDGELIKYILFHIIYNRKSDEDATKKLDILRGIGFCLDCHLYDAVITVMDLPSSDERLMIAGESFEYFFKYGLDNGIVISDEAIYEIHARYNIVFDPRLYDFILARCLAVKGPLQHDFIQRIIIQKRSEVSHHVRMHDSELFSYITNNEKAARYKNEHELFDKLHNIAAQCKYIMPHDAFAENFGEEYDEYTDNIIENSARPYIKKYNESFIDDRHKVDECEFIDYLRRFTSFRIHIKCIPENVYLIKEGLIDKRCIANYHEWIYKIESNERANTTKLDVITRNLETKNKLQADNLHFLKSTIMKYVGTW